MENRILTIPELFEKSVSRFSDNSLILEKKNGKYQSLSYFETKQCVYHFACGLMQLGLQKGDRVALMAEGRQDWLISELAMLYLGVINVPLSIKLQEPNEIKFRLKHAGCRMVITSGRQFPKIFSLIDELPEIEKLIVFDGVEQVSEKIFAFEDIASTGKKYFSNFEEQFVSLWQSIKHQDYANICYTSGTTADPKGIILSHGNYTSNTQQANSLFEVPQDYLTLLILPWDHSFAHTVGLYTIISNGASMASVDIGNSSLDTLKNIPINIKEVKPVFLLSVPALAKNFRKNIEKGIASKGKLTESLFNLALFISYKYNGIGWDKGRGWRVVLKPLVLIFDTILFSKVRENFGGRLKFFVGGGALLDIDLQRFFYALGIPMLQGYGLSEASPIISSNAPHKHKLGSSGFLVTDMELKIIDDTGNELPLYQKGEIVIKGENVMKGYWKNEKTTAETIVDGWLHTGDLGYMDSDGFLYVLGRFKSLLIGNDGEKYSPEGIEEAIVEQSEYIEQCMLYNNQNPFTIGLIFPNYSKLRIWVNKHNLNVENQSDLDKICSKISDEIGAYLSGGKYENMFPQRWIPTNILILKEGFTEENKLMNSTMKVMRDKVVHHYQKEINLIYSSETKININVLNNSNLRDSLSKEK